jgi:metallo-beta-lactamase
MENSLKKLSQMNEDIIILPGHGEQSSIGQEKKYNPFLRQL